MKQNFTKINPKHSVIGVSLYGRVNKGTLELIQSDPHQRHPAPAHTNQREREVNAKKQPQNEIRVATLFKKGGNSVSQI